MVRQCSSDLNRHEGFREFAYPDPLSKLFKQHPRMNWGYRPALEILAELRISLEDAKRLGAPWTVGFGFTANVNPATRTDRTTAARLLEQKVLDMDLVLSRKLPWYADASFVTKTVLINMAFNMGVQGLLGFKNTLRYISEKNYNQAAANMRKSLWAQQVGRRALELSDRMATQVIPPQFQA